MEREPAVVLGCPMSTEENAQEGILFGVGKENLILMIALAGVYIQIRRGREGPKQLDKR